MKMKSWMRRALRPGMVALLLAGLTSCVLISHAATTTPAIEQKSQSAATEGWPDHLWNLQRKLDNLISGYFDKPSLHNGFASSVNLQEEKNQYVVRMNLARRDLAKTEVTLKGQQLDIVAAPGQHGTTRYAQQILLPGPVQADQMKIKRQDDVVTITIPKGGALATNGAPAAPAQNDLLAPDFNQSFNRQIRQMQSEMNQLFTESFPAMEKVPALTMNGGAEFNSVKLITKPDRYVARIKLPPSELKNVQVSVQNDQLKVTAESKNRTTTSQKTPAGSSASQQSITSGSFEQIMSLPGPVNADKMQIEHQKGVVIVTLPKANNT